MALPDGRLGVRIALTDNTAVDLHLTFRASNGHSAQEVTETTIWPSTQQTPDDRNRVVLPFYHGGPKDPDAALVKLREYDETYLTPRAKQIADMASWAVAIQEALNNPKLNPWYHEASLRPEVKHPEPEFSAPSRRGGFFRNPLSGD